MYTHMRIRISYSYKKLMNPHMQTMDIKTSYKISSQIHVLDNVTKPENAYNCQKLKAMYTCADRVLYIHGFSNLIKIFIIYQSHAYNRNSLDFVANSNEQQYVYRADLLMNINLFSLRKILKLFFVLNSNC